MTENCEEERKKIYASTRQDLLARQLSNSEKYDNAILTLSTAVLGLSLAFIKDILPLGQSKYVSLLITSWALFGTAIISTIASYVSSQLAIQRQLELADDYYLKNNSQSIHTKNRPAMITELINRLSGILFVLGVVATIVFVSLNIKEVAMAKKNSLPLGASIPALQPINPDPGTRGAPIPALQPVAPPATIATPAPAPSSGNTSSGSNAKSK